MMINVFDCNMRCVSLGSRASPAAWWKEPCQWLPLPTKPCSLDKAPHRWASTSFPHYMSYIGTVYWSICGPLPVVVLLSITCIIDSLWRVLLCSLRRTRPLRTPWWLCWWRWVSGTGHWTSGCWTNTTTTCWTWWTSWSKWPTMTGTPHATDQGGDGTRERERCEERRGGQSGGEKIHFCPFTFSSDWSS